MQTGCLNCGKDYEAETHGAICPHTPGGPNSLPKIDVDTQEHRRLDANVRKLWRDVCKANDRENSDISKRGINLALDELERAETERDNFERKGKELCSAYGNSLITIHDLEEKIRGLEALIAATSKEPQVASFTTT